VSFSEGDPVQRRDEAATPAEVFARTTAPDLDVFGHAAPAGRDWSHRRGEPRIFAFFWTLYLLLATIAAFWSIGAPRTHDPLALRPAARAVLAAISIGIAVLWPMTRLCQERPSARLRRTARAVTQDVLVLLVPAQAIIWPQVAMAGWPVSVVAALSASLAAWTVLLGALLALALTLPRIGRGWWMLLFVAVAGVGPLAALGPGGGALHHAEFDWWWMTSPITSGFEIGRDRPWTGASAAVTPAHWRAIGMVTAFAAGGWALIGVVGLFQGRRAA
jgi:hypothetical protein